jgi:hypothetical protein
MSPMGTARPRTLRGRQARRPGRQALAAIAAVALLAVPLVADGPGAQARAGWDAYIAAVERRVDAELAKANGAFLVVDTLPRTVANQARTALQRGDVFVHELRPPAGAPRDVPHAMVHHWLGAILVPRASVDQVIAFVQGYDGHARWYKDVMASRTLSREGDRFHVFLKLQRSRLGVSAHYNTEHEVVYRRHGPSRASSRSRATRIAELDQAGTPGEREKTDAEQRGYLWHLDSFWRFEAAGDGVVVECESVSLSRGIPWGLGFLVGRFVKSVPRDSLEQTLTDMRAGVAATETVPRSR